MAPFSSRRSRLHASSSGRPTATGGRRTGTVPRSRNTGRRATPKRSWRWPTTRLPTRARAAGGDRYTVVVQVEEAALRRDGDGSCLLEDGPALAPETARRLACDASVRALRERNGEILDVGRKT